MGGKLLIDALGWISSLILVATIAKQVHKQWKAGSSEGVSRWLFIGQLSASVGFTAYSALVGNWVFTVTNSLMVVNALVGYAVVVHHRRRNARADEGSRASPPQAARV